MCMRVIYECEWYISMCLCGMLQTVCGVYVHVCTYKWCERMCLYTDVYVLWCVQVFHAVMCGMYEWECYTV